MRPDIPSYFTAFMGFSGIAGQLPGFAEAARSFFTDERERFVALVARWPEDVRKRLQKLSAAGRNAT